MSPFNFLKFFTSEYIGVHLPPYCPGLVGVTTFPSINTPKVWANTS